jgi:hypothetical protein
MGNSSLQCMKCTRRYRCRSTIRYYYADLIRPWCCIWNWSVSLDWSRVCVLPMVAGSEGWMRDRENGDCCAEERMSTPWCGRRGYRTCSSRRSFSSMPSTRVHDSSSGGDAANSDSLDFRLRGFFTTTCASQGGRRLWGRFVPIMIQQRLHISLSACWVVYISLINSFTDESMMLLIFSVSP